MAMVCAGGGGVLVQAHGSPVLLQTGQTGTAQQNPPGGARPEHTPPLRPQQMKVLPRPEDAPRGALTPQSSTGEVLAELVQAAGVIFAGEVYAIRMPEGQANAGTSGGLHSTNPQVVEIEFRVDHGVRGASVGGRFVLRESLEHWQQAKVQLALHERAILFLYPPDQAGLSSPVGGAVGVLPLKGIDQVELSRLHALVTAPASGTQASGTPANSPSTHSAPADSSGTHAAPPDEGTAGSSAATGEAAPVATDSSATTRDTSGTAGQQEQQGMGELTTGGGTSQTKMPELEASHAPFLAVLRDIYTLVAAQSGSGSRS